MTCKEAISKYKSLCTKTLFELPKYIKPINFDFELDIVEKNSFEKDVMNIWSHLYYGIKDVRENDKVKIELHFLNSQYSMNYVKSIVEYFRKQGVYVVWTIPSETDYFSVSFYLRG